MDRVKLEVEARDGRGKGAARKLRAAGKVPAVFYGHGLEPLALAVDAIPLERVAANGANVIVDLFGAKAAEGKPVLIREIQRDPASRKPLHCDLFAVNVRERIEVSIPFHFEGRPRGVIEQGGVLEPLLRELDVNCMPLAIPDSITVDVSALEIGDIIYVRDLTLPEGIELEIETDQPVVHVVAPRVEEEPTAEAEEVEGAAAEGEAAEGAAAEGTAPEGDGEA